MRRHVRRLAWLATLGVAASGCAALKTAATVTGVGGASIARAEGAMDRIDDDDERAVGQASSFHVIEGYGGLLLEEGLNAYLNDLANHVGMQGRRQVTLSDGRLRVTARRFFVGVLNDDSHAAFALPGGYIFVTRGLLEDLGSESELAWVLGHEIAHVDYEDGLVGVKAQVAGGSLLTGGTLDFSDNKVFGKIVGAVTDHLLRNGWDKDAETRADKLGLQYAAAAGYDPHAATRVLRLLETNKSRTKSHAEPGERADLLEAEIQRLAASRRGKLGVQRYDRECIRHLESALIAVGNGGGTGGAP